MRYLLSALICALSLTVSAQSVEVLSAKDTELYRFNLEKILFRNDEALTAELRLFAGRLSSVKAGLEVPAAKDWPALLALYNETEFIYRKLDLYYFLQFALDMRNRRADVAGDSLRNEIRVLRTLIKSKIAVMPPADLVTAKAADPGNARFYETVRQDAGHLATPATDSLLRPFQYLKSSRYYDDALARIRFDSLKAGNTVINVGRQMSAWQEHPDENVRREGSKKFFAGYASQRDELAAGYIAMVKGLDAFAKTKNFPGLIAEKLYAMSLSDSTLSAFFKEIISHPARHAKQEDTSPKPVLRYTADGARQILNISLSVLGEDYARELSALLDPSNGRMDLHGGEHRIPIRGTASVYPIPVSIFYAYNYEGYLIDLVLLAHEAGHAVQAGLMYRNKVPMVYATGPGYFTEAFGKFNELLLFDQLSRSEKMPRMRQAYAAELQKRLQVIYGSTLEAYVEYELVQGIVSGKINSADQLDQVTAAAGSKIRPEQFLKAPEEKGLWMLLETNFRDPLHNVNDMVASILAARFYQLYLQNPKDFLPKYLNLLRAGYPASPAALLIPFGIDLGKPGLVSGVLTFINNR